jgi:hypothetical protein
MRYVALTSVLLLDWFNCWKEKCWRFGIVLGFNEWTFFMRDDVGKPCKAI